VERRLTDGQIKQERDINVYRRTDKRTGPIAELERQFHG
jgi:hypothetical protein